MKNDHIRIILTGIVAGVFIGCAVGVLGLTRVIPLDDYRFVTELIIKGGLGLIVLIIDALCVFGLIRPRMIQNIFRNGVTVTGRIEETGMISHPKHIGDPESIRPARFRFVVSYTAEGEQFRQELSPTCLTTKRDLSPLSTEEGGQIPLKYLKSRPNEVVIDNEALMNGLIAEHKASRVHLIMIPVIVTLAFILAVIAL